MNNLNITVDNVSNNQKALRECKPLMKLTTSCTF